MCCDDYHSHGLGLVVIESTTSTIVKDATAKGSVIKASKGGGLELTAASSRVASLASSSASSITYVQSN